LPFIYLFMFASMIRLQREPAGEEVMPVPGGRPVAMTVARLGFTVTTGALVYVTAARRRT
jgi:hypothetical protein